MRLWTLKSRKEKWENLDTKTKKALSNYTGEICSVYLHVATLGDLDKVTHGYSELRDAAKEARKGKDASGARAAEDGDALPEEARKKPNYWELASALAERRISE